MNSLVVIWALMCAQVDGSISFTQAFNNQEDCIKAIFKEEKPATDTLFYCQQINVSNKDYWDTK